jgi:hypothetical protein
MRAIVLLFGMAVLAVADEPKSKDVPKADGDDAIAKCVVALRAKDAKTRLKAADDLKAIGADAAKKAGNPLCKALADPSQPVRKAALAATETVLPDLYEDLSAIKRGKSDDAIMAAVRRIGDKGEKGTAAAPVIVDLYKSEVLQDATANQASVKDLVDALVSIKAKDSATTKALGDAAQMSRVGAIRYLSLNGLSRLSTDDKEMQKQLLPMVKKAIVDPDREVCLFAMSSIGAYGQDARDVVPVLRRFKQSPDLGLRKAADSAINAIQAAAFAP